MTEPMSYSLSGVASRRPRVYLAGPEVFLPDAATVGERKIALCEAHGLEGVFPLDNAIDLTGLAPAAQARAIARANEELMRSCAALIANLTPFRGPSMDCGTTFEVGFMRALDRPVFGYSTAAADYRARVLEFRRTTPAWADGDRPTSTVEDFGLPENLMIAIAIHESGHAPILSPKAGEDISDVAAFSACLAAVAPLILSRWTRSRT